MQFWKLLVGLKADGAGLLVSQKCFLSVLALAILAICPASLAQVATEKLSGSGVVVGARGEILTNAHVVEGCRTITAQISSDKVEPATLLVRDQKNDLAVLRTSVPVGTAAVFREGTLIRAGDTVVALGYPLAGLLATTTNVSVGAVSALAGLGDDSRHLQISAPVQPGNSGGPLLDASGHLVGIVTSKLNAVRVARFTGDVPQNVNFAIKADVARAFLDSRSIKYQTARSDQQLSPADIADIGRAFTVYVECARATPASISAQHPSSPQAPLSPRQASVPGQTPGTFATIGGVFIRLPMPSGFCDLDESNAFDKRSISRVTDMATKSGNKLLGISVDCRQRSELRTGKRQLFDDFVVYHTPIGSMDKPPSETVAQACATLRHKGDQMLANRLPDVKARIESTYKEIKINEVSFIGVLAEDANACYAGLIRKIQTDVGTEKTQITVLATTLIRTKFVFTLRSSSYHNAQTIDAVLHNLKVDVAALVAANR
jgi:trypsin-like peptidase